MHVGEVIRLWGYSGTIDYCNPINQSWVFAQKSNDDITEVFTYTAWRPGAIHAEKVPLFSLGIGGAFPELYVLGTTKDRTWPSDVAGSRVTNREQPDFVCILLACAMPEQPEHKKMALLHVQKLLDKVTQLDGPTNQIQEKQRIIQAIESRALYLLVSELTQKYSPELIGEWENIIRKTEEAKRSASRAAGQQAPSYSVHPDQVGEPPRLASHANRPVKRSCPIGRTMQTYTASILASKNLASSGASSGAAGGAAGGAADKASPRAPAPGQSLLHIGEVIRLIGSDQSFVFARKCGGSYTTKTKVFTYTAWRPGDMRRGSPALRDRYRRRRP